MWLKKLNTDYYFNFIEGFLHLKLDFITIRAMGCRCVTYQKKKKKNAKYIFNWTASAIKHILVENVYKKYEIIGELIFVYSI